MTILGPTNTSMIRGCDFEPMTMIMLMACLYVHPECVSRKVDHGGHVRYIGIVHASKIPPGKDNS
jgi:hypothetical protein